MEKLSLALVFIGVSVFVFSLWSLLSIKRHLRAFKNNYKHSSALTDEKYYELKSRQEYIIAISAVIFSIISFIGYSSIDNIKADMNDRLNTEIKKLDSLSKMANANYSGLEIRGKTYQDSVKSAFNVLAVLNNRMKQLFTKDVITQDIYIVDPLRIGDFPKDLSSGYDEGLHVVKFDNLRTINGKRLPTFKEKPSIICIANSNGTINLKDIFLDRFIVQLESYTPKMPKDEGDNVTFTAWISQKPGSEGVSPDLK